MKAKERKMLKGCLPVYSQRHEAREEVHRGKAARAVDKQKVTSTVKYYQM